MPDGHLGFESFGNCCSVGIFNTQRSVEFGQNGVKNKKGPRKMARSVRAARKDRVNRVITLYNNVIYIYIVVVCRLLCWLLCHTLRGNVAGR